MKNKESVKQVYDEIHAPDALFGKVMKMNKKESKMRNVVKYAVGVAAAFAVTMLVSNGVCYAATGETWISKAIVYINGEESEQEIIWHQDGELVYGELEIPVTDGEDSSVEVFDFVSDGVPGQVLVITEDGNLPDGSEEAFYTQDTFTAEIEEKDGRVFLNVDGESIDITEDIRDGEATGTLEYAGLAFTYKVTGTAEEYQLELCAE